MYIYVIHIYLLQLFFVGCSSHAALTLEVAGTVFRKNVGKLSPSDTVAHLRLESLFIFLFSIANSDTLKHYDHVWKTECVQNV